MTELFDHIGIQLDEGPHEVRSPITQRVIARVPAHGDEDAERAAALAQERFLQWREVPAPLRGSVVRAFGELVRRHKAALGELISIEVGKIRTEGLGEVQEVIDI
ncbi:MAG TPA: aldehyde dehydrogenase family protein, partial [Burkholderiaceae bacterium]|nr:aldehyde dehydrogenase family protein [Burkholderiaceae bacterium]